MNTTEHRIKVCMITEGCYPYEVGGVSSWVHSMIKSFPQIDFSLIAIISDRSKSGKFKYELPENLISVYEVYLNDYEWINKRNIGKNKKQYLSAEQRQALRSLISSENVDWKGLFKLFSKKNLSIDKLLMGKDFFELIVDFYENRYYSLPFTDFLWTMRSMYLTLFLAMKAPKVKADIYHCVATGYAGIIGAMQKAANPNAKLIVTEHGIYTREREEEIIRASWVQGVFKDIWINQFRKMSLCAYEYADVVTSLFAAARKQQTELGCDGSKAIVIPNGVDVEKFACAVPKDADDKYFNLGAFVRVTQIKDIKTMIMSFYYAHRKNENMRLWIMGPTEEESEYFKECEALVISLGAKDIIFTGTINTLDYIGKMDALILTSISEGQPLTILEGFSAKKPCIATNVGNCYDLIYGETDNYGAAGIVCPIMNVPKISEAILLLASDRKLICEMGENGYRRVKSRYKREDMKKAYGELYSVLPKKQKRREL